jgi:hypothetical protein
MRRGHKPGRQHRQQQARPQVDGHLHPQHGHIVGRPEQDKARGQKQRIPGQADERRANALVLCKSINVVSQHVLREVAVKQGVAPKRRMVQHEPGAQSPASQQGRRPP